VDVAGYSELAGAGEERTLARLRAFCSGLIYPTIALRHGRVVKRLARGDVTPQLSRCQLLEQRLGLLQIARVKPFGKSDARSSRASSRLPCRAREWHPGHRIEFRAGIHLGYWWSEATVTRWVMV
jgi:hypothetical protein